MLIIYVQDENMCKTMYREEETNGKRKKKERGCVC